MSSRWWLDPVRRLLQNLLAWVDSKRRESPRKDKASLLSREIHVPTPLVTLGAAVVLFFLLLPQVGFSPQKVFAPGGVDRLVGGLFRHVFPLRSAAVYSRRRSGFLTGLCLILGVGLVEVPLFSSALLAIRRARGRDHIGHDAALDVRLALLVTVVLSIFCGVLNNFSFNAMFVAFFSSCAAMLAGHQVRHRGDILRAGFHVMWVSAICIYGLGLFHAWPARLTVERMGWGVVNGGLCALIPLGLLPVLESFFSRVTAITLLEVGDFNRPLLRRLMIEAPGTYHHTLLVAAMAEQAADAIGANSLLCRVGMYYHDIGKLVQPDYFIENQTMRRSPRDKPEFHDRLNPSISSLVIMAHVKEGMALARAHKVPEEVVRFIQEHHGTSLIKYFYMRALEQDDEQTPPRGSLPLSGSPPHSRETVIAMLADSVEAASRTVEEPTYERLKDLVEKIVNSKFMDGQFDEAPVTLQDLRKIIDSFAQSLSAIYHVRIEYPELPETDKSQKLPPSQSRPA